MRQMLPTLSASFSTSLGAQDTLSLELDGTGSGRLVVPLPSGPSVAFFVGPETTVGDLKTQLASADAGASDVVVRSPSGVSLAGATPWSWVLRDSSVAAGAPLGLSVGGVEHVVHPSYTGEGGGGQGVLDLAGLLKKEDYSAVAKKLKRDPRSAMAKAEFVEICSRYEIDEIEAESLARNLGGTGAILYFYDEPSLADTLFIKPKEVWGALHRTLDLMTPHEIAAATPKDHLLATMEDEIKPMAEVKAMIEKKADASASRMMFVGLMGAVAQITLVARLTFWEFSWDIMEPVSYVLMIGQAVALHFFYQVTKSDPDSYSGLREYFRRRKFEKLAAQHQFDQDAFDTLTEAYERIRAGSPRVRSEEAQRELAHRVAADLLEQYEHEHASLQQKATQKEE